MPLSLNINTYQDVAAILQAAHAAGTEATYRLKTPGAARQWQMRAYKYRLLLQQQGKAASNVKGFQPATPYDSMRLRLEGTAVLINFLPEPQGELTLPGGKVIKPQAALAEPRAASTEPLDAPLFSPKKAPPALSDLSDFAAQLLAEHGDED